MKHYNHTWLSLGCCIFRPYVAVTEICCPSDAFTVAHHRTAIIERVSTRVVVVVVVVVAQPHMYAYACAHHASSVREPKSHSSLPKHLPLHTEESLEKVHPATNFTNQSLAASLVK